MYDELVKGLRNLSRFMTGQDQTDLRDAADAIEELSARLEAHNEWFAKADKKIEEYKAAYIAEHDARIEEIKRHKWIPVEERLPDNEQSVFVVRKFLGVKGQVPPSTYTEIAYRIDDMWYAYSDEYKIARHRHTDPLFWMPLPEPPKEET